MTSITPPAIAQALPPFKPLDAKQIQLLDYLRLGYVHKAIAKDLGIRPESARRLYKDLYAYLGVSDKLAAANWYRDIYLPQTNQRTTCKQMIVATPPDDSAEFFGWYAGHKGLLSALGASRYYLGGKEKTLWGWLLAGDLAAAQAFSEASSTANAFSAEAAALLAALHLINDAPAETSQHWVAMADSAHQTVLMAFQQGLTHRNWQPLHALADQPHHFNSPKHLAMVLLYYGYQKNADLDRATAVANALFMEASAIGQYLQHLTPIFHAPGCLPTPAGIGDVTDVP
ncbi:MAG: hypothetical protein JNM52_02645 [Betaproteobacteria bacterium]|nr:hypothetical protein [Betaproteobacteria bacterium]